MLTMLSGKLNETEMVYSFIFSSSKLSMCAVACREKKLYINLFGFDLWLLFPSFLKCSHINRNTQSLLLKGKITWKAIANWEIVFSKLQSIAEKKTNFKAIEEEFLKYNQFSCFWKWYFSLQLLTKQISPCIYSISLIFNRYKSRMLFLYWMIIKYTYHLSVKSVYSFVGKLATNHAESCCWFSVRVHAPFHHMQFPLTFYVKLFRA